MGTFRRFRAWRACYDLTVSIYRSTHDWPATERFALTSQLRRAALSAGTNIAEGSAKRGAAEFGRYLDIAIGSLAEVEHLLLMARELGLTTQGEWRLLEDRRELAARQTHRLSQRIRSAASSSSGLDKTAARA